MDWGAWEAWCRRRLRPSTAHRTITALETLHVLFQRRERWPESAHYHHAVRRAARFLDLEGLEGRTPFDREIIRVAEQLRKDPPRAPRRRVRGEPEAFRPHDWQRLRAALWADESPAGHVLLLQSRTGHRVGDLLSMERTELIRALNHDRGIGIEVKGGKVRKIPMIEPVREVALKLRRAWPREHHTLADWVGGVAYNKCLRRLQQLCRELGIDERVYTHRLRRTVANDVYDRTKSVRTVQLLLGHEAITTTERYLDRREEEVAAALELINQ